MKCKTNDAWFPLGCAEWTDPLMSKKVQLRFPTPRLSPSSVDLLLRFLSQKDGGRGRIGESTITETFFLYPAAYFLTTNSTTTCMSLLMEFGQERSQAGKSGIDKPHVSLTSLKEKSNFIHILVFPANSFQSHLLDAGLP